MRVSSANQHRMTQLRRTRSGLPGAGLLIAGVISMMMWATIVVIVSIV